MSLLCKCRSDDPFLKTVPVRVMVIISGQEHVMKHDDFDKISEKKMVMIEIMIMVIMMMITIAMM